MFAKCKGEMFLPSPGLKGRGGFYSWEALPTIIYYKYIHEGIYMTSGSKYRIVGWMLLWCSGLFCSLPSLLLSVSGLASVVGELAPESVLGEVT
jgi:hypothetical protein